MTIKAGRPTAAPDLQRTIKRTIKRAAGTGPLPRNALSATVHGRNVMAEDYFDAPQTIRTFATGAWINVVLRTLIPVGAFVADAATRALFATGFISKDLLAGGFHKATVIAGGVAGAHTVTGIRAADELVSVWGQDGVTAQLSNLTGEFTISGDDTIDNTGGTDTTGSQLIVQYTDLTP